MVILSTLITSRPPSKIPIPLLRLLEPPLSTLKRLPMHGERAPHQTLDQFSHWLKVNLDQIQPTMITISIPLLTKSPLTTPPGGKNTTIKFQNKKVLTPGEKVSPP